MKILIRRWLFPSCRSLIMTLSHGLAQRIGTNYNMETDYQFNGKGDSFLLKQSNLKGVLSQGNFLGRHVDYFLIREEETGTLNIFPYTVSWNSQSQPAVRNVSFCAHLWNSVNTFWLKCEWVWWVGI